MLVVSELSEALEADRKGNYFDQTMFDAIFTDFSEFNNERFKATFEDLIKDTFEDELADAVIRLFDMAEGRGMDLEFHIDAKLRYNSLREYKHGKSY